MIYVTYIYKDFWGTDYTLKSVMKHGILVKIIRTSDNTNDILNQLYQAYREVQNEHETMIYADCADSFFQNSFEPPKDRIVYQTEKACFPFVAQAPHFDKMSSSRWRYLNGGGYCGSTRLIIEFFEKYKLLNIGSKNAQWAQQEAFLLAKSDGFPIDLDFNCEYFQSVAFSELDEFEVKNGRVQNLITGTSAPILHGNGRSDMKWIYDLL